RWQHGRKCPLAGIRGNAEMGDWETETWLFISSFPHCLKRQRGHGLQLRIVAGLASTFAIGTHCPSILTRTMSAVKSLFGPVSEQLERREEPTPYTSTGTPIASNARMRSGLKPPVAVILTF